jgi:hypothetical protein
MAPKEKVTGRMMTMSDRHGAGARICLEREAACLGEVFRGAEGERKEVGGGSDGSSGWGNPR